MSELDALRAALAKVNRGLPVAKGEDWDTTTALWYNDGDLCADVEENPARGVGSDDMAQALALSVNLAPPLLAVEEAARRLHGLLEDVVRGPESAGIDLACSTAPLAKELRDALQGLEDALRVADAEECEP